MWWKAWDCWVGDWKEVSYYLMFEVWSLRVVDGKACTRKIDFVGAILKRQCSVEEKALGFKVVEQMATDWYRMVSCAWYAQ